MGPLMTIRGLVGAVVVEVPRHAASGAFMASIVASSRGMCSGWAPAMTPRTATSSTVSMPWRGGTTHSTSEGARLVPLSISRTRSTVGGMMGSESDHLRLANSLFTSA